MKAKYLKLETHNILDEFDLQEYVDQGCKLVTFTQTEHKGFVYYFECDEPNNILTCVYCGEAYPAGTPASGADVSVLTEHIKECLKHPMHKLQTRLDIFKDVVKSCAQMDSTGKLVLPQSELLSILEVDDFEKL